MPPLPPSQHQTQGSRALILTGASGYIGERLVELARIQGRRVVILSRHPGAHARAWNLGDPLPADALLPGLPPERHALVHLAHDWRDPDANRAGTLALLASARALGLGRVVFVSSQSARQDAANVYGRLKWELEQHLSGPGECAARVGLVYGGPAKAQWGLLQRITRLPVLPMIEPWRPVQPIHLDEVCQGLLTLADQSPSQTATKDPLPPAGEGLGEGGQAAKAAPSEPEIHPLAGAPVPFGTFLRTLARELHGKSLPIIPIPLRPALLAADLSAAIPFGPTVDRERILGLAGTRPMETEASLQALGLALAPLPAALRREPAARKAALRDTRRLLRYILRREPGAALLRRTHRALEAAGLDGPVPRMLRLAEPWKPGSPLRRRLDLATELAEASPESHHALHRASLPTLALHLAADAVALPLRLIRRR